jgi:hypothetical protein
MAFVLPQAIGRALPLERCHGFGLRCTTAGAASPRRTLPFCCNGQVFLQQWSMGAAIYLALVGGGLTAAFLLTVLLRGIRLI